MPRHSRREPTRHDAHGRRDTVVLPDPTGECSQALLPIRRRLQIGKASGPVQNKVNTGFLRGFFFVEPNEVKRAEDAKLREAKQ